tara:strand:+ start:775 stop:1044 length:270 start_codon:yes stop_codon:yes gene_type:complete
LASFLACNAEWLAGKACRNHIDKPRVFFSGTGLDEVVNVSEDWGFVEETVFDPLLDDFLAVGFPLDIADSSPVQKFCAEDTAPGSCEER